MAHFASTDSTDRKNEVALFARPEDDVPDPQMTTDVANPDPGSPDGGPSEIETQREKFRTGRRIRSYGISLLSTAILVVLVSVGLANSPGWPTVKRTFFSGKYFLDSFRYSPAHPSVIHGLGVDMEVLVFSLIGTAILSLLLATIRLSRSAIMFPLRVLAVVYTTVMRGIPMIVLLYLIGFGIPGLHLTGRIDPMILGTIAIILNYSAYVSEVLRSGLEAINPSQRESARSLGLTAGQTIWIVLVPQGLRNVAPALMNEFVGLMKAASLTSVIGVVDAVQSAKTLTDLSYNFTSYTVAALLFIIITVPFVVINDWYSGKLRKREKKGGLV